MRAALNESTPDGHALRAWLRREPDLIRDDPALLADLGLRLDASNVIEFGPAALSRVAKAHLQETTVRKDLEALAQANFAAQAQTHGAVIDLLDARNNSDLGRRLDDLARDRFGLVAAVIALEGPDRVPAGWRVLAPTQADQILGAGKSARLGVIPTANGLFNERGADVRSLAMVRLELWEPKRTGVLAFGSDDPAAFGPDMGHELVDFLARVIERTAQRWPAI